MRVSHRHSRRLIAGGADGKTGRHQRVLDLEFADQRQPDRIGLAAMFERELLREPLDHGLPMRLRLPVVQD